ncbi:hypothetical protein [Rubinisphaera margarita]|uniref:hypothetical protein n=1 Tax=Rubinisphaera margarita TaxID=2909586 RepID=UPI001EE7F9A0|nr:hypothetical protein [Rubinisphaera margarita]MCG6154619.1 hypothetical protein [Rubinisphaera margarita]
MWWSIRITTPEIGDTVDRAPCSEVMEDLFFRIFSSKICMKRYARGFSVEEILAMEDLTKAQIPPLYQIFLSRLGRYSAALFCNGQGSFRSIDRYLEVHSLITECLQEQGAHDLIADGIVPIFNENGDKFYFLLSSDGAVDPRVFEFSDIEGRGPRSTGVKYTSWLGERVAESMECMKYWKWYQVIDYHLWLKEYR